MKTAVELCAAVFLFLTACLPGGSYRTSKGAGATDLKVDSGSAKVPLDSLSDMVRVQSPNHSFYIDRFENAELAPGDFFSARNQLPAVSLTVEKARSICRTRGRRLCTKSEWTNACLGIHRRIYSYGNKYVKNRCNVSGERRIVAGEKDECKSDLGIYDMPGNVMEWVEDNRNGKGIALGGSFNSGEGADCFSSFYFPPDFKSEHIGFRCCL